MAMMRVQDRTLFTTTEFTMIQSSFPSEIKSLSMFRLKSQVTRARRYWDKYRGLTRQQHRAKKRDTGKGNARPFSNVRTERKAQVFAGALKRFEKRLEQLTREERRRSRLQAKSIPKSTRRPVAQREAMRRKKQQREAADEAALAPRITREFQKSKMRAIQGHISASGKRRQGKRDAR